MISEVKIDDQFHDGGTEQLVAEAAPFTNCFQRAWCQIKMGSKDLPGDPRLGLKNVSRKPDGIKW